MKHIHVQRTLYNVHVCKMFFLHPLMIIKWSKMQIKVSLNISASMEGYLWHHVLLCITTGKSTYRSGQILFFSVRRHQGIRIYLPPKTAPLKFWIIIWSIILTPFSNLYLIPKINKSLQLVCSVNPAYVRTLIHSHYCSCSNYSLAVT